MARTEWNDQLGWLRLDWSCAVHLLEIHFRITCRRNNFKLTRIVSRHLPTMLYAANSAIFSKWNNCVSSLNMPVPVKSNSLSVISVPPVFDRKMNVACRKFTPSTLSWWSRSDVRASNTPDGILSTSSKMKRERGHFFTASITVDLRVAWNIKVPWKYPIVINAKHIRKHLLTSLHSPDNSSHLTPLENPSVPWTFGWKYCSIPVYTNALQCDRQRNSFRFPVYHENLERTALLIYPNDCNAIARRPLIVYERCADRKR